MNRENKISLLSKFRESYYQNLLENKELNQLRLFIDIINDDMKESYQSNKRLSSDALKIHLKIRFNFNISLENIDKCKSWKKQLFIRNHKTKIYHQKF